MTNHDNAAWVRLHDAITTECAARGWTKGKLYEAVGVSESTFKKMGDGVGLSRNFTPKMRSIERGLGWPAGTAEEVLSGVAAPTPAVPDTADVEMSGVTVASALAELSRAVAVLTEEVRLRLPLAE